MDLALVEPRTAVALPPRSVTRLGRPVRVPAILAWMVVAIATITALAYWDEERESTAALDEFAQEQLTLAESLSASLEDDNPAPAGTVECTARSAPTTACPRLRTTSIAPATNRPQRGPSGGAAPSSATSTVPGSSAERARTTRSVFGT